MQNKVAIIGAGLAGLYAARLLRAAHVDFVLIEARDRLGGRILSVGNDGLPGEDGFDLGPSWYWPQMQPVMAELVAELDLPFFAQNSEGDVIFERMSRETAQRYRGMAQEPQSMRLGCGSAALVRALEAGIPEGSVMLSARVTAISLTSDGATLTVQGGDGSSEKVSVRHVIAALPPRLLEASVNFTPALDAIDTLRWSETPTWMAPHAKFFAIYDRPFWRDNGLSGTAQSMVGPMVEMHDATTASGKAALFGFLGVGADQRAAIGEEGLKAACLDQFVRVFGPEARQPAATVLKDWAADPLTATVADRNAGGHVVPGNTPWVTGPWREHLTLAGSETSPTEAGYLAGAVTAARLAVAEALDRLGEGDGDA